MYMPIENLADYAPVIVVIIGFLIQQRLVVTPEQLERTHREILCEIELRYAKLDTVSDLREQVYDINVKITKLYELVVKALRNKDTEGF